MSTTSTPVTAEQRTATGKTIPEHPAVPACRLGNCNVCETCDRVHHGTGSTCIRCWNPAPWKPRP